MLAFGESEGFARPPCGADAIPLGGQGWLEALERWLIRFDEY
jgi:hypothetical protein